MITFCSGNGFAFGIDEGIDHSDFLLGRVFVVHINLTIMNINSPLLDVNGIGFGKPYMTVDARP